MNHAPSSRHTVELGEPAEPAELLPPQTQARSLEWPGTDTKLLPRTRLCCALKSSSCWRSIGAPAEYRLATPSPPLTVVVGLWLRFSCSAAQRH